MKINKASIIPKWLSLLKKFIQVLKKKKRSNIIWVRDWIIAIKFKIKFVVKLWNHLKFVKF